MKAETWRKPVWLRLRIGDKLQVPWADDALGKPTVKSVTVVYADQVAGRKPVVETEDGGRLSLSHTSVAAKEALWLKGPAWRCQICGKSLLPDQPTHCAYCRERRLLEVK